jgi:hypothetical protein
MMGLRTGGKTEDRMKWIKDTTPNSNGEALFLGPWNVGDIHYDSLSSKGDVMKYTATCKLPGVKWPGKFQTAKEAKVAVEYSVNHWLSQLPSGCWLINYVPKCEAPPTRTPA